MECFRPPEAGKTRNAPRSGIFSRPVRSVDMELSKKNRDAISQLAQSSDAQKLMALLNRQSGHVQEAARQAAAGDPSQLMTIMNQLMHSKEGAELVDRIGSQAKQAGLE